MIAGIIGFFYDAELRRRRLDPKSDDVFGLLAVNAWHNIVHILTGVLGLLAVGYAARTYALGLGLVYVVVAFLGFIDFASGDLNDTILQIIPVNTEDNFLHLRSACSASPRSGDAEGGGTRRGAGAPSQQPASNAARRSAPARAFRLRVGCGHAGADARRPWAGSHTARRSRRSRRRTRSSACTGWPQSSYMWRTCCPRLPRRAAGRSLPTLPATATRRRIPPRRFERHVEARRELAPPVGLDRVVRRRPRHRWADRPALGMRPPRAVCGLVITNTGFFPDQEWVEIAVTMRTPLQGEALVDSVSREGFGTLLDAVLGRVQRTLRSTSTGRRSQPSRGATGCSSSTARSSSTSSSPTRERLAGLGVPALVLWGQADEFLPVGYASRFARQIPGAELVLLEGVRHFLFEDEPERCAREVTDFLARTVD